MAVLLPFVAVGVWVGLDHLAAYAERLEKLAETDSTEAAAAVTQLTRSLAVLNGLVLGLLAAAIIWHGWRGWRDEAMPPTGSRVLEGKRTWAGEPAVRIAKFTLVVGVLLGVLGVVSSVILWNLGDAILQRV